MKYVFILAAVAVLLIGFASFYLFGPTVEREVSQDISQPTEVAPETQQNESLTGRGTLQDIQSFQSNLECQVVSNVLSEGNVTGTMFVADGDIRTDFLLTSDEFGEYAASVIVLDDFIYSWSQIEGSNYGLKIATANAQEEESGTNAPLPVDMNDSIQYTCAEWKVVDRSVFTPPSDVLFQDAMQIQAGGMEYGTIYEEGEMPY